MLSRLAKVSLLAVGLVVAGPAAARADDASAQSGRVLLESAHYWQTHSRSDLAAQAYEKYLLIHPRDARVWYDLGMLGIRTGQPKQCVDVVRRMRQKLPSDPHTSALAGECRVATTQRLAIAGVRLLAEKSHYAAAGKAFRALFSDGMPSGELGLEYLEIRDGAGAGPAELDRPFRQLAEDFPEDKKIQLGYAGYLSHRSATAAEAIRRLRALAGAPGIERKQLLKYWRAAIRNLPEDVDRRAEVEAYLKVDPGDASLQRQATRLASEAARARGRGLIATGEDAEAVKVLEAALRADPDNVWLRYDAARALVGMKRAAAMRQLMAQGVVVAPHDPEMRHAFALLLDSIGAEGDALTQLRAVPAAQRSASMTTLYRRLSFDQCLKGSGPALLTCDRLAGSDAGRWKRLADLWLAQGLGDAGVQRLRAWHARHAGNTALDLIWVRLLVRTGHADEAGRVLQRLQARADLLPADEAAIAKLQVRLALTAFMHDGVRAPLLARIRALQAAAATRPPRAWRYRLIARIQSALGQPEAGAETLGQLLACCTVTLADRLAYADALRASGHQRQAVKQLVRAWQMDAPLTQRIDAAERLVNWGEYAVAVPMFRAALAARPEEPWWRYHLADSLQALGRGDEAVALMRAGVKEAPDNAQMRFATALVLSGQDKDGAALVQLAAIAPAARTDSMRSMQQRLQFGRCLDRGGDHGRLLNCERYAGDDAGRWLRLTSARIANGHTEEAMARLRDWYRGRSSDVDAGFTWLRALALAKRDAQLKTALDAWYARPDLNHRTREELLKIETDWRLARGHGRRWLEPLLARIDQQLAAHPHDAQLLRLRARINTARGDHARAAQLYAALTALPSVRPADRLAYADALYASGQRAAARRQLNIAWAADPSVAARIAVAEHWRTDARKGRSNPFLAMLLKNHPRDYRVAQAVARQALAEHKPRVALRYLGDASTLAPSSRKNGIATEAQAIRDQRHALAAGGFQQIDIPGTNGFSQLHLSTLMLEQRLPVHWDQQLVFKIDPTRIAAGRLQPADAESFGSLATLTSSAQAGYFPQPAAAESGIGLGVAWQTKRWRLDIGTTPLGFPHPYPVGGAALFGDLGSFDWGVSISRRAMNSTLLSYAGARDPVTGKFWGDARKDSIQLDLARYEANYDYAASLDLRRISGRNIPGNNGLIARVRASRKLLALPHATLFLGLHASYWTYDKNQRFYTFGQGGYYSPQSYVSVSFPLDLRGGFKHWSYQVRGGVAYSRSREDNADYFPGRADLQQAAAALGVRPVHQGAGGGSVSFQFETRVEYALTNRLSVGASYSRDDADFYKPQTFMVYIRHTLGSGTPNLEVPPHPIFPYSDY